MSNGKELDYFFSSSPSKFRTPETARREAEAKDPTRGSSLTERFTALQRKIAEREESGVVEPVGERFMKGLFDPEPIVDLAKGVGGFIGRGLDRTAEEVDKIEGVFTPDYALSAIRGFGKEAYDSIKDVPASEIAKGVAKTGAQLAATRIPGSPMAKSLYGAATGVAGEVVDDALSGDLTPADDLGRYIQTSLLTEVFPGLLPLAKTGAGNIATKAKRKLHKLEGPPGSAKYANAADVNSPALLQNMDMVEETAGKRQLTKEMARSSNRMIAEKLDEGIPKNLSGTERLRGIKQNYINRINQYEDMEINLLNTVDDYKANQFKSLETISEQSDFLADPDNFITIREITPEFIREYDLDPRLIATKQHDPTAMRLGQVTDDVSRSRFDVAEQSTEWVPSAERSTALGANRLLKAIQKKLRENRVYDISPEAGANVGNVADLQKIQNQNAKLNELASSIKEQIQDYTERVAAQGSREGIPAFDNMLRDARGNKLSFKEINQRQHELLGFKPAFGTDMETLGDFEIKLASPLNESRVARAESKAAGAMDVARRSQWTTMQQGASVADMLTPKEVLRERYLQEAMKLPEKFADDYNYIRAVREGAIPKPSYPELTIGDTGLGMNRAGMTVPEQPLPQDPEDPSTLGNMQLQDISLMQEAFAEELGPVPMPRDIDIILQNEKYLDQIRNHPMLGPDAIKMMTTAAQRNSPHIAKKVLYQMMQNAPDVFEETISGYKSEVRVGNSLTIADPREALLAKQEIGEKLERGEIKDTVWAANQISAFNSPYDMRIIPTKEQEEEFRRRLNPEEETRPRSVAENLREVSMKTIETPVGTRVEPGGEGDMGKIPGPAGDVEDSLRSRGFSDAAIAGILGNVDVETGGSFSHTQKQIGGGGGYGLFQFDFMRPYYKEWLADSGLEDTPDNQVEYVHQTIYGDIPMLGSADKRALRKALDEMDDPEAIAEVFSNHFLKPGKPHLSRRVAAAGDYYKRLKA